MPTVTKDNRELLLREFYRRSGDRINIAIFSDCYYPLIGGITIRVHNQAEALSKRANVVVVTGRVGKYSDEVVDYPVIRCRGISVSDYQGNVALPSLDFKFKRLLKGLDVDVILVHTYFGMNKAAHWLHKKSGAPVVQVSHQRLYPEYVNVVKFKWLARILSNFSMRRMDRAEEIWTVSKNVAAFYRESGFDREMFLDPSGSDRSYPADAAQRILDVNEKFGLASDERVLLCLCRMEMKQKNLDFLLRAFALAQGAGLNAKLFMVGKGADQKWLEAIAGELGLGDCTIFTGFADDDVATGLYLRSDLFLFPSLFDNFGLTKTEAAALGTPTLALEGTAVAEDMEDGINGFVSRNDEQAFAARMLEAFADPAKLAEISQNARETMGRTWEELASVTLEEIRRVLARHPKISD